MNSLIESVLGRDKPYIEDIRPYIKKLEAQLDVLAEPTPPTLARLMGILLRYDSLTESLTTPAVSIGGQEWVYLDSGELPPLKQEGYCQPFMSNDVLLTIETPSHAWVATGRRNLNCPNGWDCPTVDFAPDVRKITAWAYPQSPPPEIQPAPRRPAAPQPAKPADHV